MKRVLMILLLLIVPLQFAWASAGAYCLHEDAAAPMHFGHHSHTHAKTSEGDTPDSKTKFNKAHLDCSSCHTPANGLFVSLAPIKVLAPRLERQAPDSLIYTSFIPDGPRRPDRLPGV